MIDCKLVDSQMDPNQKLMTEQSKPFSNAERYKGSVGKLIYVTITRPDLPFAVGVVSQFVQTPCIDNWNVVLHILKYLKKVQDTIYYMKIKEVAKYLNIVMLIWLGLLLTDVPLSDSVFIRGNISSWKSKKHNVVAQSSVEVEYSAMTSLTCEFLCIKQFVQELKFCEIHPLRMYCDNQATLNIASDIVFHERTIHKNKLSSCYGKKNCCLRKFILSLLASMINLRTF